MPDPNYQIIVSENFDAILALTALSIIAIGAVYKTAKYLIIQKPQNPRAKEGKLAEKAQKPQ